MPLSLIIFCFIFAYVLKNKRTKKLFFFFGFFLLVVFSNDFLINEIMLKWEISAVPLQEIKAPYDVAIVLSGVTDSEKAPRDRVYLNKGADRIMHTVHLYRLGKIKRILISGGSGRLLVQDYKESEAIKNVLLLSGVAAEHIFIDDASRNTHENAVYSAEILNEKFSGKTYLLVTSAFHMRRAQACFQKVGVKADSFPTDFYTFERKFTPDVFVVPSDMAVVKWGIMIKEWLGMVAYKIAGYI